MFNVKWISLSIACALLPSLAMADEVIDSAAALVAAVRDGTEGATIQIAPGVYELESPLEPKAGMTLRGAGSTKVLSKTVEPYLLRSELVIKTDAGVRNSANKAGNTLPETIELIDEPYWPPRGDLSKVTVLATSDESVPKGSDNIGPQPMFWTCQHGAGRIFACVPGHFTWTFDDPYFRILLLRGMAWAAGESPYRFDPLVTRGIPLR